MPVRKTKTVREEPVHESVVCDHAGACQCYPRMSSNARKFFIVLFGILLVYAIVWVATLIRNNLASYRFIGQADRSERTMLLSAEAKVKVTPDVAVTSIGMVNTAPTVAEAQQKNTSVMNALIERLKGMGIDAADIQTSNYNIYPQYNYTEKEGRVLLGYEVSQNVQVKIRDVQKANQVFAIAGEVGANNVGGLQFVVDNHEAYLTKAREEALQKIAEKKASLATALGVSLGDVVAYHEFEGGNTGVIQYKGIAEDAMGGGNPAIEPGSAEVVLTVNVTYEVR